MDKDEIQKLSNDLLSLLHADLESACNAMCEDGICPFCMEDSNSDAIISCQFRAKGICKHSRNGQAYLIDKLNNFFSNQGIKVLPQVNNLVGSVNNQQHSNASNVSNVNNNPGTFNIVNVKRIILDENLDVVEDHSTINSITTNDVTKLIEVVNHKVSNNTNNKKTSKERRKEYYKNVILKRKNKKQKKNRG